MKYTWLHAEPTAQRMGALILITFLLRAAMMSFVVQPHGYFRQADSIDYHIGGYAIAHGLGMYHPRSQDPLFWRTPGYAAYLAPFYAMFGSDELEFNKSQTAQYAALWAQIFLSSCIPIIIFYLALLLSQQLAIAWLASFICVLHVGLILASTYLLSEGMALIFFYLFLLLLFQLILSNKRWLILLLLCVASLSAYTWMRPNGEPIALVAVMSLILFSLGTWRMRLGKGLLFLSLFFLSLFPWYLRNYNLTNEWFFAPTIGPYLNVFCAPKIISRATGKPLLDCWKACQQAGGIAAYNKRQELRGSGLYVSPLVCKPVALQVIKKYPWWFLQDWLQEVNKTTLDLYSYQLVAMAIDAYHSDPLHELLTEKLSATLYAEPKLPWYARLLAWIELFYAFWLWLGVLLGAGVFVAAPIYQWCMRKKPINPNTIRMFKIWFIAGLLVAAIIVPSGGFGYARLRLPAEPLLMILALITWAALYYKYTKHSPQRYQSALRTP